MILRQNPTVWSNVHDYYAAWSDFFGMRENEGKYLSIRTPSDHGFGPGYGWHEFGLRNAEAFPSLTVNNPLHQWETADDITKGDKFWGKFGSEIENAMEKIWGGVQYHSSAEVELNWLQVYGSAITIKQTLAEGAQKSQDLYLKMAQPAWFDIERRRLTAEADEFEYQRAKRLAQHAEQAGLNDAEADVEKILKHRKDEQAAAHKLNVDLTAKQTPQNMLAATIVPDKTKLNNQQVSLLHPEGLTVTMDRTMFARADGIPSLLSAEGYSERLPERLKPMPGTADYRAALSAHFPAKAGQFGSVPDLFSLGGQKAFSDLFHLEGLPAESQDQAFPHNVDLEEGSYNSALALESLNHVFSPMTTDEEETLASSPKIRLLVLQKSLVKRIYEKSLQLKKRTRVTGRIGLDLSSAPTIASLLGLSLDKPSKSTVLSLDELHDAAENRLRSLDEQIAAEGTSIRLNYRNARTKRQEALQHYFAMIDALATETDILDTDLAADPNFVAADPVISYLSAEALTRVANGYLVDARQADSEARFYTTEVQSALDAEFLGFHVAVGKAVLPDNTLTEEDYNIQLPGENVPFTATPEKAPEAPAETPKKDQPISQVKRSGASLYSMKEATIPLIGAFYGLSYVVSHIVDLFGWASNKGDSWVTTLSLLAITIALALPIKRSRIHSSVRVAIPFIMALVITSVVPAVGFLAHLAAFTALALLLFLFYRNGTSKRIPLAAILLLFVAGLGGLGYKALSWLEQSDESPIVAFEDQSSQSQGTGLNYSVGISPIHMPKKWAPPSGESFIVTTVNRQYVGPKAPPVPKFLPDGRRFYIVAQEPLSVDLASRLRNATEFWNKKLPMGESLIPGDLINTTQYGRPALVHVLSRQSSTAFERRINDKLDELEVLTQDAPRLIAQAAYRARITGKSVTAESLQLEQMILRAQSIGNDIFEMLSDRNEIDVPVGLSFMIYGDGGMIAEGTPINGLVELFTQSFPHDSSVQPGMTPDDALAFIRNSHLFPKKVSLHFFTTDNKSVSVSLAQIAQSPVEEDSILNPPHSAGDYRGAGTFSNPVAGTEKNIVWPLVIYWGKGRSGDMESQRLLFDGVYVGDKRVTESMEGGTIASVQLVPQPPTTPPYHAQRATLEAKRSEMNSFSFA